MNIIKFVIVILTSFNLSCATIDYDTAYRDILKKAKSENISLTFMKMRTYLRAYPDSTHAPELKFGIAEYYFQNRIYNEAIDELTQYITAYPKEKNVVFARALLYKIILEYESEKPQRLKKAEKLLFSEPVFLSFADSKMKQYTSILNNNYKIVDYIDRVEVFINGDLIFKISL